MTFSAKENIPQQEDISSRHRAVFLPLIIRRTHCCLSEDRESRNWGWCNSFHVGFRLCWHTNVAACCLRHVYSQTLCLPIKVFSDKRTLVTVGQWLTSQEWERTYEVKPDPVWSQNADINEHLNYSVFTGRLLWKSRYLNHGLISGIHSLYK